MNDTNENELKKREEAGAAAEPSEQDAFAEREALPETPAEEETDAAAEAETKDDKDEEKRPPFADAYEWVSSLVYAVLAMLVLNLFAFRSITVDGPSMNDTLQDQDKVISTNFCYEPNYGDIVIVQADQLVNSKTGMYGEPIIKRVIGLEGDTIRFDFEKGEVYRNGELLQEDYIKDLTKRPLFSQSGVDYIVPEHCVYIMGDNRMNSRDSRDTVYVGYIDKDLIIGKAILRVYPFNSFGAL